ncbi:MAG: DUF308 domain-containing protein [Promethearchaeota archaeon]
MRENYLITLNIIFGLIIIILSTIVISIQNMDLSITIFLLTMGILLIGIIRLFNSILDKKVNRTGIITKFLSGMVAIILSITIFVFLLNPMLYVFLLIDLFGVVILVIGISRILVGVLTRKYTKNFRILTILIGLISITFSVIIFSSHTFSIHFLLLLISFAILINGFARVMQSIVNFR